MYRYAPILVMSNLAVILDNFLASLTAVSSPLRTIVYQCPSDSFVDENSSCISAVTGETPRSVTDCTAENECPSDEACRNGFCQSPCNCAPESIFRVINRKPVCACREGLIGDPLVACYKVGCQVNEECPGTHAWVNGNVVLEVQAM